MLAELKFNTDNPEHKEEFETCLKAPSYKLSLYELDRYLRDEIKYRDKEEYQAVRDKLWEILESNDIHDLD